MGSTKRQLTFKAENQRRIEAVEKSFRPVGRRLLDPDRILIGEGRLMKQSRREPQPRAFFLFNDMLVYGSIVINGRWFKRQKVIPLEDIELEDLENGLHMKYQWLVKTPQKSFYVSAASQEEKQAWMEHIQLCKAQLLESRGLRASSTFAVTWIPDPSSAVCMRCTKKFTVTHRRHHCRKCGFLVCGVCSKKRAVINHIHPTKQLRVCEKCHNAWVFEDSCRDSDTNRVRGDSSGQRSDEEGLSSDEQLCEDHRENRMEEDPNPVYWSASEMDSFSPYVYLRPEHVWAAQ